jgi:ribosomal-protein-alanine N-acetyltransferase
MLLQEPTVSDYEAIASWIPDAAASLRWAGPLLPFPFSSPDLPSLLAVPWDGQSSYCLIDESCKPCGFGQHWVLQQGAVHLGRIIVAPDARGRGIGRVLCQQLIFAALRATSAAAVTLRAYKDNHAAVALYSSLGFVEVASESTADVLFMKLLANEPVEPTRDSDSTLNITKHTVTAPMLSSEVQNSAAHSVLCWLATVDGNGQPNVSPKEIFAVFDTEHLVVANIASPTSVDFTRFSRHLLRSKLNWRVSHEESQIPSGIQS